MVKLIKSACNVVTKYSCYSFTFQKLQVGFLLWIMDNL